MTTVVGTFERRADAESAAVELVSVGISRNEIVLLTPEVNPEELASVPVTTGEQPGIVKGIGAVTGGAVGLAAASLLAPGLGPVLAIGLTGGALLGAMTGAAIGGAVEDSFFAGIPEQELFFYEDALRKGRSVLVASASDHTRIDAVRGILEYAGAESIDRARHMWWLGIRDVEKEKYDPISDFVADEPDFRAGFEAALYTRNREQSYREYAKRLGDRNLPRARNREAFRHGYERGQAYLQARQQALVERLHS